MQMALKNKPDIPFRVPPGIKLISVDARSGQRSTGGNSILEAFKPGTAPPEGYSASNASPRQLDNGADVDQGIGSGTGGLY